MNKNLLIFMDGIVCLFFLTSEWNNMLSRLCEGSFMIKS